MKIIIAFLVFILSISLVRAQFYVPVYVTTSSFPDATEEPKIIAYPGVDYGYNKVDTAYREAYEGFNVIVVDSKAYPIHLESYDDFNAASFITSDTVNITYSGAQGAIKNDFLLKRHQAFTNFTNNAQKLSEDEIEFNKQLDSLTTYWKQELDKYPFSEIFIADELMFYKSYTAFYDLYFKMLNKGSRYQDASLNDYPDLDYKSERYYDMLPYFKVLARNYHFKKVLELSSVGAARSYLNNLPGYAMANDVKGKALIYATEHHPRARDLYKISKPLYMPHSSMDRRFYRNSKRQSIGDNFKFPDAFMVDSKPFDLQSIEDKQIYLLIYDISNPRLGAVLTAWNKFSQQNKSTDVQFVAYAINGTRNIDLWKSLQFKASIAGLNAVGPPGKSASYLEDIGTYLLPRIIKIAPDGKILNPNVDLGLDKRNVFEPNNFTRSE